jgi:hypothetical protein
MTTLKERLCDMGLEEALIMDEYDDCVVGYLERYGTPPIVLYDRERVIDKIMEFDPDGTYEEACEYYSFNQLGGWHGDMTPGFLVRILPENEPVDANEFAKRMEQMKTQAIVNSRKFKGSRQGSQWKIVSDLVDKVVTAKVLGNLKQPDKNNQPPQY